MIEMIFLGIDPGMNGALVFLKNEEAIACPFKNLTEKDIADLFISPVISGDHFAVMEAVHSMPKQGVSSSFKFGRNFGLLLGILYTQSIPFVLVSPQKWQKALGCLSHGDKNITKSAAQRLFPNMKITHAVADALLLAEYGRREYSITH